MARVLAVVTDLMLVSRVTTSLDAAGHRVEQASSVPEDLDGIDVLVTDLDAVSAESLAGIGVPVIAFYRHTDAETKRRADEAGLAVVVPRSRMVRELPELVEGILTARD